jgi:putative chitinase
MNLTEQDFKDLGCRNYKPYVKWINLFAVLFNINTVNRILAFFPNILQESGDFFYTEELASGIAYEGRKDLGNLLKGDGKLFKGRGLGQTTGRKNYQAFTDFVKKELKENVDFIKNPELLVEPKWAVLSAFFFWKQNGLEQYADEGDFQAVCAIWNTGRDTTPTTKINGWNDRVKRYEKVIKWLQKVITNE